MKKRMIYRVEGADGIGPYQPNDERLRSRYNDAFQELCDEMADAHNSGWRVVLLKVCVAKALHIPDAKRPQYFFGCTTERGLRRWFGKYLKRIAALDTSFSVINYEVPSGSVIAFGGHAAFIKAEATCVSRVPLAQFVGLTP